MAQGTITYTGKLMVRTCWCGIYHAVPSDLDYQIREKGATGYCPLGHSYVSAGTPEAETERARANRAEARETALRDQLEASERSKRALKGVVTRTKRRIGKGVCPCCNRHFANVERHMDSQHPEYADQP